jgi:hypothetical protein
MTRAEKIARATERLQRSEKRIAQFKRAHAAVGIPVTEETIARMAALEPVNLTCRMTPESDEQEG